MKKSTFLIGLISAAVTLLMMCGNNKKTITALLSGHRKPFKWRFEINDPLIIYKEFSLPKMEQRLAEITLKRWSRLHLVLLKNSVY